MTAYDFIARFILFVIPGIIVYLEFLYLTGRQPAAELLSVAYVFIASTMSFVAGNGMMAAANLIPVIELEPVDVVQVLSGDGRSLTTPGVAFAILAAFLLGLLAVAVVENRLMFRLLNKLGISRKTDNEDVWDSLFELQSWIILRDYVTGNTYYGRVEAYSDKHDQRELLLEDVWVWGERDGDYQMEKVYISRLPSEFSIEIDDYRKGKKSYDEMCYRIKKKK